MSSEIPAILNINYKSGDGDREQYGVTFHYPDRLPFPLGSTQEVAAGDRGAITERIGQITRDLSILESSSESTSIAELAEKLQKLGKLLCNTYIPPDIINVLKDLSSPLVVSTELNDLPWELLHTGGDDFLALKVPMVRNPVITAYKSGAVGELLKIRQSPICALLACNPGIPKLLMVEKEIRILIQMLQNSQVTVKQMGREIQDSIDLRADLANGDFALVHFAGHGHFEAHDPSHSFIKIFNTNGEEQELTAQQLYDNMAGAPVLFLNACQSAQEAPDERDFLYLAGGTKGFASLAISGGALAFIGAQWPVLDLSAALFSVSFYQSLLAGDCMGKAILKARRACSKGELANEIQALIPDPIPKLLTSQVTWANFVFYGQPHMQVITV